MSALLFVTPAAANAASLSITFVPYCVRARPFPPPFLSGRRRRFAAHPLPSFFTSLQLDHDHTFPGLERNTLRPDSGVWSHEMYEMSMGFQI